MATLNDAAGQNVDDEVNKQTDLVPNNRGMENDQAHLDPSRWWFASSAFPMIAGTLGPVASAFSICALVRPWRQDMRGTTIDAVPPPPFVKDPAWLLIVNGIQLVVAVVSNIFLLLNMARRVRFSIAQPITIVGWYISSICLLSLNATAAGPLVLEPSSDYVWSQAFWYGMWAAILYFLIASLMVVTVYGAYMGHYSKDFQLTNSQRTLMLQTIMLLLYMLVGALVFSTIEGWQYLDAVYWADVTLFTVGFGDFACETNLGRALLLPYALVGVISLGLVIGSIRSMVLERGRRKLDARMVEKKRRKIVKVMHKKGDDTILKPIRGEENPEITANMTDEKLKRAEFERRQAEFELMRHIQHQASVRRRWVAMAVSTGSWLILWTVGAKIFQEFEKPYQGWTYFDGFYFVFVTLTTIGYGDRTPISNGGRSFFVFWSLLALPTMTVLISNAGDTVVKVIRDSTLSLGNVTILPGERGLRTDLRRMFHKMSFGKLFKQSMVVPGFHGAAENVRDREGRNADSERYNTKAADTAEKNASKAGKERPAPMGRAGGSDIEGQLGHQNMPSARTSQTTIRRDPRVSLPEDPSEYHYLLISEIAAVTQDLKSAKPSRYSFHEWAWFLKLIGEDESSPETHRKAKPRTKDEKKKAGSRSILNKNKHRRRSRSRLYRRTYADRVEEEGTKWSWVGMRSPLMGSIEESEWILERLTERLQEELAAARRQAIARGRPEEIERNSMEDDYEETGDEVDYGNSINGDAVGSRDTEDDEIEPKKAQ